MTTRAQGKDTPSEPKFSGEGDKRRMKMEKKGK
jgi:hypothetical protein